MKSDDTTFYVLLLIDETGAEHLEAAYRDRALAEGRGRASGKKFRVCMAHL